MAYEKTLVPVARTQQHIKELIHKHGGFGTAFVSQTDPSKATSVEELQAKVMMDGKAYAVRVKAKTKAPSKHLSERQRQLFVHQEEKRIWRVLYYHLKGVYEAADSGVMEFRELMLPYLVTAQGDTIAERLLPQLDMALNSKRLTMGEDEDASGRPPPTSP
jgi:hypothetical protein